MLVNRELSVAQDAREPAAQVSTERSDLAQYSSLATKSAPRSLAPVSINGDVDARRPRARQAAGR